MNDEQQIIESVPTLAGYKKIPTFKLWIANQFPYIETDFDAITNYELLQAVIKYLNTIIENENNVESNVTALYNAFVNLHDYVENFFDNLDVQEEINNKLDEMVEDGTLESILLNYTQITKTFGTYNDMMLDTSTYVNGMKLKTLGYHYINDGGGAEYIVTNVQSDTKYQVSIGINLWIELIINDSINVKQLGAYGDDVNDDTNPLQIALNLSNKYTIIIPKGVYLIASTLEISNKNNIIIKGPDSIIHYTGNDYAIKMKAITYSIFDFGIINAPNGSCIKIESLENDSWSQYVTINFIIMKSLNNCLHAYCENGWINEFRINQGKFETGQNGILLENNKNSNSIASWTLNELGFEGVKNGLNLKSTQGVISQIRVENCRYAEIITYSGKLLVTSGICRNITIYGDVNIQSSLITTTTETEHLYLNAPCVYYSKTYNKGGYYKNNIFIPNESNEIQLIDGIQITDSSTDFNSLTECGSYMMSSTILASMGNTPTTSGSYPARLIVMGTIQNIFSPQSPNTRLLQILFAGDNVWLRRISKTNSSYSYGNWKMLSGT